MRKKRLGSPSSAVRKDRLGKRGTSWGRLSHLREAGWGNGGGREEAGRGFSPRKGSQVSGLAPDRLPGGSPPEVTTLGRLDSRASLGPRESQRHPLSDMLLQAPSPTRRPGSPHPDPHGGHRSPHRAPFALGVPRPAASLGSPGSPAPAGFSPPPPAGSHLRGAPVAELVGDGLDAAGPGHRDVAALRAHVQPHNRHGRLSVRLRLGSV